MNIIKIIQERKLEMVNESQQAERQRQILEAQLGQVRGKLLELDTELKVLHQWEKRLAPNKEKE